MCFPMLGMLAGIGMSALQAGASMQAKQEQYAQQVRQYQENVSNSEAADRDQQVQLGLRQEQEQGLASQKMQAQSVQGAIKRAQVSAAASGANVTGLSVDNIIADVNRTVDSNMATLRTNALATAQQLQAQKVAGVDQDQGRINQVAIPLAPDPTGDLLGVAGSALGSFGKFAGGGGGSGGSSGAGAGLDLGFLGG